MFKLLKDLTEALILALAVFFVLQVSVQNFKVEGSSMSPTLESGQYVTVSKLGYVKMEMAKLARLVPFWDASEEPKGLPFQSHGPERGSIVVFHFPLNPERNFVKRVIGLPGDTVSIKRGVTYIDGKPLDEPYVRTPKNNENAEYPTVADDEYFVMGDNRLYSNDSRHWGPVPLEKFIGNKWFNYDLPFDVGFVNEAK